uniref:Uncharacterized protein n=1 Tax=Anopheles farauti TaxID=69004 RepID=A0A182Q788_9DIPT
MEAPGTSVEREGSGSHNSGPLLDTTFTLDHVHEPQRERIVNDIPDVVVSCPSNMNVSTSSRMSAVLSGFPSTQLIEERVPALRVELIFVRVELNLPDRLFRLQLLASRFDHGVGEIVQLLDHTSLLPCERIQEKQGRELTQCTKHTAEDKLRHLFHPAGVLVVRIFLGVDLNTHGGGYGLGHQHVRLVIEHIHKLVQHFKMERRGDDTPPLEPLLTVREQQTGAEPGLEELQLLTFLVKLEQAAQRLASGGSEIAPSPTTTTTTTTTHGTTEMSANGGFCGAIQRAPPPIPAGLARRMANRENIGLGKPCQARNRPDGGVALVLTVIGTGMFTIFSQ